MECRNCSIWRVRASIPRTRRNRWRWNRWGRADGADQRGVCHGQVRRLETVSMPIAVSTAAASSPAFPPTASDRTMISASRADTSSHRSSVECTKPRVAANRLNWSSGGRERRAGSLCTTATWPAPACSSSSGTTATEPINLGGGIDLSIAEVARTVADVVGFRGRLRFDASKPDGVPFKRLDSSPLLKMGWRPSVSFQDGLTETYKWLLCQETGGVRYARSAV